MPCKEEYLDTVCKEIKFAEIKSYVRRELSAHIDDKTREFISQGISNAEEAAVAAMGDAEQTGRAFNKAHKPRIEWGVIVCVLLLSFASLIMIAISSYRDVAFISGWMPGNQIVTIILGFCVIWGAYFFDYRLLIRLRYPFLVMSFIMLAYNLLILQYEELSYFGLLSSAPTFSLVLLLTSLFGFFGKNINQGLLRLMRVTLVCCISTAALVFSLCSFEALILSPIYIFMLAAAVNRLQYKRLNKIFYLFISFFTIMAVYAVSSQLSCIIRIGTAPEGILTGFFSLSGRGPNAEAVQAMLNGAQLIGPSPYYIQNQSWSLRSSGKDFILTSIIAQYGWLAGIGAMLIFSTLIVIMYRRSSQVPHTFGRIMAIGISSFFIIKFIIFLFSNLGIYSGLSCGLPFLSFGNLDYTASSLLIGIYLSVWRRSSFMKDSISSNILVEPFLQA